MNEPKIIHTAIKNVICGKNVQIVQPSNLYGCQLGDNVFIGPFVEVQNGVKIGNNTKVQSHSFICEKVVIGNHCTIAHGVMFINDLFRSGRPAMGDKKMWKETIVGDNVSFGTNSTILPITICQNVVIGAGSVVTKDINVLGIYAGNPARMIRMLGKYGDEINKYIQIADLNAQYLELKKEIDSAIEKTIQTSMFIRGEEVEVFEDEYAKLHGVKHCISCGNGTDALYITLKGLNISEGDEVITTSHSWISTSEAISQAGGVPIFCDTDTETYCIDATKIRNLITERTVGILPVHLYGHPAEMKKIKEIADEFKLWVVEDCAQAHIAEYENKKVGTFGIASTFILSRKEFRAFGDAGCILTNDDNLAEWCRLYSRHGGKGNIILKA